MADRDLNPSRTLCAIHGPRFTEHTISESLVRRVESWPVDRLVGTAKIANDVDPRIDGISAAGLREHRRVDQEGRVLVCDHAARPDALGVLDRIDDIDVSVPSLVWVKDSLQDTSRYLSRQVDLCT